MTDLLLKNRHVPTLKILEQQYSHANFCCLRCDVKFIAPCEVKSTTTNTIFHLFLLFFISRAQNTGQSMDNVRPEWWLDLTKHWFHLLVMMMGRAYSSFLKTATSWNCCCAGLYGHNLNISNFFFIMSTGQKWDMSELKPVCLVNITVLHAKIILSPVFSHLRTHWKQY